MSDRRLIDNAVTNGRFADNCVTDARIVSIGPDDPSHPLLLATMAHLRAVLAERQAIRARCRWCRLGWLGRVLGHDHGVPDPSEYSAGFLRANSQDLSG